MNNDEITWVRRMTPQDEAELIRRLAADRAMGALRHRAGCLRDACRVQRTVCRRRLRRAVAA